MARPCPAALALLVLTLLALRAGASNPLIKHRFAADPSAHVWKGDPDTLYVYASHDVDNATDHAEMVDYYVYSTQDMVNWEDHGMVMHLDNVTWAKANAWAPDAAYRNGTYYLVYCAIESSTGMFRTGLAASSSPAGLFQDTGFIEGVEWGQDPSLFVDDDGTPYLVWGLGGHAFGAQLAPDFRSVVPGTTRSLKAELTAIYEGPWLYKAPNGLYTMMYPALRDPEEGQSLDYATASHPLGPYTSRGELMGTRRTAGTESWTNHGSIAEFKGQWFLFYHVAWGSGTDKRRSICAEPLQHHADGSIDHVESTRAGVGNIGAAASEPVSAAADFDGGSGSVDGWGEHQDGAEYGGSGRAGEHHHQQHGGAQEDGQEGALQEHHHHHHHRRLVEVDE